MAEQDRGEDGEGDEEDGTDVCRCVESGCEGFTSGAEQLRGGFCGLPLRR